jgi:hypothetical protein
MNLNMKRLESKVSEQLAKQMELLTHHLSIYRPRNDSNQPSGQDFKSIAGSPMRDKNHSTREMDQ